MTPRPTDPPSGLRFLLRRGFRLGSPSLRGRFLAVLLFGSVLPLGLMGWWLAASTRWSGEELLQTRLEETLSEVIQTIGFDWVDLRSDLLALTEIDAVRTALAEGRDVLPAGDTAGLRELEATWAGVREAVNAVVFHDLNGEVRGRFPIEDLSVAGHRGTSRASIFPLRIEVYGGGSQGRIGTMEVHVRTGSLISSGLILPGLGGSVLALFDASGRFPLLPLAMDPELFTRDRFEWAGETWLALRDTLYEPPLQLVLAAPLGALGQPFRDATRRGLIALLLVTVCASGIAILATRKITRPLENLALGADSVARGKLDQVVPGEGPDEIRRVASAFNAMTESLRQTLKELSQREALAAIGEFAASLAHEVRNPLTAMRLDVQRAKKHLNNPDQAGELLDHALHEIGRLDRSVTDGLRLARSGLPSSALLDLRDPLNAAFHAAEPQFSSRGTTLLPVEAPEGPVLVEGDAGQLEQLFLNLLLNAAEALEESGRARIRVKTTGDTVEILIQDEGRGISATVLEKVFEPFFSTSSEGTGLGLPIARQIARAHRGDLLLESFQGIGTTAQVTLPVKGEAS